MKFSVILSPCNWDHFSNGGFDGTPCPLLVTHNGPCGFHPSPNWIGYGGPSHLLWSWNMAQLALRSSEMDWAVCDLHDLFLGTSSHGGFASHDPQRVAIGKPPAHQADSTRVRGRLWVPWRHGKRGIIREIFPGNSGNSQENIWIKLERFRGILRVFEGFCWGFPRMIRMSQQKFRGWPASWGTWPSGNEIWQSPIKYGGFHSHGGTQNGWFLLGKIPI